LDPIAEYLIERPTPVIKEALKTFENTDDLENALYYEAREPEQLAALYEAFPYKWSDTLSGAMGLEGWLALMDTTANRRTRLEAAEKVVDLVIEGDFAEMTLGDLQRYNNPALDRVLSGNRYTINEAWDQHKGEHEADPE